MAETFPTDSALSAMAGSYLPPGMWLYPIGASPHWADNFKALWRTARALVVPSGLEVYKDDGGELKYGVRAGLFASGDTMVSYAGAAGQDLVNDVTNYIYLTADGTLTTNTTVFPDPSILPHIPLATIATGTQSDAGLTGYYDFADITDYRGRSMFAVLAGMTAANANTLAGGSNADSLHVHAAAGLAAAVQDAIPDLNVTFGAEAADKITVTVQARDAADNNLAERMAVRVWISTSNYAGPSEGGNTVTITAAMILQTIAANAHYVVITDAAGKVEVGITVAGAATRYLMAEIDGRIYSSGVITWAA